MRFNISLVIGLFCFFTLMSCDKNKTIKNKSEDYSFIPIPKEMIPMDARFNVKDIIIASPKSLENEASLLKELFNGVNRETASIVYDDYSEANVHLILDNSIEKKEGYALNVSYDKVSIAGKTPKGIFYGIQTLRQLLLPTYNKENASELTLPAVKITDYPNFGYRGVHLDVSRHFFSVNYIKKFIDLLAMHKMNTFHWHLTDDQGWRIEIKKYPKLTAVGAYRYGTIIGNLPGTGNDNKRYGGYYTQEQIKDVVAYASKNHIDVIPEIEMPGHASAAIAAYPYLSCFPQEKTVVTNDMLSDKGREMQSQGVNKVVQETWGVFNDVFCAGKDSTFVFLQNVIDEVASLFPSKYIHIGGDECPKDNWNRCPLCKQRMKIEGLNDAHDLQSYFVQRMEKYINGKGKQIIGWDEILEGGLAPNATVMSWRGEKGGITAAKQKHDVIMTPTTYCYFDYYQSKDRAKEPLAIGGFLPVKKVFSYNPLPDSLPLDKKRYILGAQGNIWTEYITTTEKLEYMALPRLTALSEVVWRQKTIADETDLNHKFDDFKIRFNRFSKVLDDAGFNYAKHILTEGK